MGCKHARGRQQGVIGRLRAVFHLAPTNRDLSARLTAVTAYLAQCDLTVTAVHDDGFAEGLAAGIGIRWAPALPGPAVRHLSSVPSIRSGGHNLTGTLIRA
jgi:hypothetical protein